MKTVLFSFIFALGSLNARELVESDYAIPAKNLIDNKKAVGIAISIVQPSGVSTISFGETKLGNNSLFDLNSFFEVGSITKGFTGILLGFAISEGKVKLTDSVQKLLPQFQIPKGKRDIVVKDLATHRSGLPSSYDSGFKPKDTLNPWAQFSKAELQNLLRRIKLTSEPGEAYSYSNLGAALIGQILEVLYKKPYEVILKEKILVPMKMLDSGITLTPNQHKRMVSGYYNNKGQFILIPTWEMPGIAAAGALRTTMGDMIAFAKGILALNPKIRGPLDLAIRDYNSGIPQLAESRSGLFWVIMPKSNFFWHNGATYGKTSFIGFNLKKKSAVIIFCNTMNVTQDESTLGMQLMRLVDQ